MRFRAFTQRVKIEHRLAQTVFHDVPHTPGFKSYDKHNLEGALASVLSPARDLQLVSLSAKALRKLPI